MNFGVSLVCKLVNCTFNF